MSRRRSVAAGLAAVALATATVGCGVTTEDRASQIEPEQVPFGLLEPEAEEPVEPAATARALDLYFARQDGSLVAVPRPLPQDASLLDVVEALAEPPTEPTQPDEPIPGSGLGDAAVVAGVESSRGVATVDLDASFLELAPDSQATAIAQIVYTLTGRPGVGRVTFTLDGEPVEVPSGDGSLTGDALAREDFRERVRAGG